MGRTLHTRILRTEPIPPEIWRKVESAAAAMNDCFTWTCENLGLQLLDDEERERMAYEPDSPSEPPVQADDFTKVASDEWNALLVVRFMRWVSTLLPDAVVTVRDEGDYVLAGNVIFEAGNVRLNEVRVARQREYLAETKQSWLIKPLDVAVSLAEQYGIYFAQIYAAEYADRKEIAALEIPKQDLAKLSINEVADLIRFPWEEQAA
jgi:hypothetical protein